MSFQNLGDRLNASTNPEIAKAVREFNAEARRAEVLLDKKQQMEWVVRLEDVDTTSHLRRGQS